MFSKKKLISLLISPLLLSPLVGFAHSNVKTAAVKTTPDNTPHTINIYNNSNKTIFPVAEVATKGSDGQHTVYHAYLSTATPQGVRGVDLGVPANEHVTFKLPSAMWNESARVYLFTKQPTPGQNETPVSQNNGQQGNVLIYENKKGADFPLDDPYQLVEYTFKNGNVDYDISYVDHIYLPVAVEVNSGSIGYKGTGMAVSPFQQQVNAFINDPSAAWPHYLLPAGSTMTKIPGGYDVFAQDQDHSSHYPSKLTLLGQRVQSVGGLNNGEGQTLALHNMMHKWVSWETDDKYCAQINGANANAADAAYCHAFQTTVRNVWAKFEANAKANGISNPTNFQIVSHIVGYIPFSKGGSNWGSLDTHQNHYSVIALLEGIPYAADESQYNDKMYPAYSSPYALDPYVTFVHRTLKLNAYAFSIDDAIGNVNVAGNGFTIAVGGLNGIPNKKPYNPGGGNGPSGQSNIRVSYATNWSKAIISGKDTKTVPLMSKGSSFSVGNYGDHIQLIAKDGVTIGFTVNKSDNPKAAVSCDAGPEQNVCIHQIAQAANVSQGDLIVPVPPAPKKAPEGGAVISLYTGGEAVDYSNDKGKPVAAHSHAVISVPENGGSITMQTEGKVVTCTVTVQGDSISPSSNCSDGNGYGKFVVRNSKDADGFIVMSP